MPRTCTISWRPHGTLETPCNGGNPMQPTASKKMRSREQGGYSTVRWEPHGMLETSWKAARERRIKDTSEPAGGGVR
jgi:hypothetical protein